MVNSPKLYLDSCSFIDAVKEEIGDVPTERTADVWYIKQLLRAHKAGDVIIYTSMLALAECVAIESGQSVVPADIQDRFRRLLTSGQYVRLHTPSPSTGEISQNLRWEHKLVLGGPDAMHIAAALELRCLEFITTDERLVKPKMKAVMPKLSALGLNLIKARDTKHLPSAYTQTGFFDGQPEAKN